MIGFLLATIAYVRAYAVSRHRLGLEAAVLRQQLIVFKRKQPRPSLRNIDRISWIAIRRLWTGWAGALIIVKTETVVSWHRAGFRLFWRLRSRPLGRPKIGHEMRALIRRMKMENPGWGAPRIHGELMSLRLHGFGTHSLALPAAAETLLRRREGKAVVDLSAQSSRGDGRL